MLHEAYDSVQKLRDWELSQFGEGKPISFRFAWKHFF